MRRNSAIIGPKRVLAKATPEEAKILDLYDQHIAKLSDIWPDAASIDPNVVATTGSGSNTTMGQTHTYEVAATGFDHNSETIYWEIIIPADSPWSLDYFSSTTGSFTIGTNNTGTFSATIYNVPSRDMGYNGEGPQTYKFNFYRGSVGGTLIGTSYNFTVPDFYVGEARIADNATSYNEGIVNGYWQLLTYNAPTMNISVNYTSGYLMPGLGGGSTTSGFSRMVLIDGLGTSGNKYRMRTTPLLDGSVTNSSGYFKYMGSGDNLNYTLVLNSSATSGDYIRLWTRDPSIGVWSSEYTLYGDGASTVSYTGIVALSHDEEVWVEVKNNSSATGIQCFGTELWMSNALNSASDSVLVSEITNELTSFNASSGSTFTDYFNVDADFLTEGTETLFVWWYTSAVNASDTNWYVLGWDDIAINDTSTTANISVATSSTSISEGDSVTFTITDSNSSQTGTLYYTLESQTGGITSADFSTAISGSIAMTNGSATLVMTTVVNDSAESTENFRVLIRQGSTSGTIVANSSYVNITNVVPNMTNSIISIPNVNVVFDPTTTDYTGAFDVLDVTVPSGYSGTAAIYMGLRVTTSTTYINDICIGGVQVLNSSGTSLLYSYIFNGNAGGTYGAGWRTLSGQFVDGTSRATLSASLKYIINTSTNTGRWTWATQTGSSYTGAADGIADGYDTSILPSPGNGVVSQVANAYYAYREVSGSTRFSTAWAKSPDISWSGGEKIRICYHFSTQSTMSSSVDGNDSIRITLI